MATTPSNKYKKITKGLTRTAIILTSLPKKIEKFNHGISCFVRIEPPKIPYPLYIEPIRKDMEECSL